MRWPWQRRETRQSGGDFSDSVIRLLEAQAAGSAADASSTAAVEAAAGALSRAFAGAEVQGEPWIQDAVSPTYLAQVGRDLVRSGDSMHVLRVGPMGDVSLIPASSWHWEGSHDPSTWTVRVTCYGPSTSTTWHLPASGVVFTRWGGTPGQPYVGRRWHLGTVLPLARLLEHELSMKLESPVRLKFDSYAMDMVSRATVVAKLTQAGVASGVALAAVGLLADAA